MGPLAASFTGNKLGVFQAPALLHLPGLTARPTEPLWVAYCLVFLSNKKKKTPGEPRVEYKQKQTLVVFPSRSKLIKAVFYILDVGQPLC